jgi:hypothetical protein
VDKFLQAIGKAMAAVGRAVGRFLVAVNPFRYLNEQGFRGALAVSPLAAEAAVVVYAASQPRPESGSTFLSVLAVGTAIIAAALFAGLLVGFLFALPKVREHATVSKESALTTNTNLDKVSDWLTTILVGLGLVELGKAAHGIGRLGHSLAPALGGSASAQTLGIALMLYATTAGFLLGYIWTRIDLSERFHDAAMKLNWSRRRQAAATEPIAPPPGDKA